MAAQIIAFFQRAPYVTRDWSQQEVAEFYRVESALVQAGVQLESDRGLSDEGDPWFIFCRGDNGEVFMHFARIDGLYVVDGASFDEPARGLDFAALIQRLISRYPLAKARQRTENNIFVHPAALLIALVGAAFFHTNDAKAAEAHDSKVEPRRHSSLLTLAAPSVTVTFSQAAQRQPIETDAAQAAAILLSAVLALHEDGLGLPSGLTPAFGAGPLAGLSGDFAAVAMPAAPSPGLDLDPLTSSLLVSPSETLGKAIILTHNSLALAQDLIPAQEVTAPSLVLADLAAPRIMAGPALETVVTPPVPLQVTITGASATKPLYIVKMSAAPVPAAEAITVAAASQALSEVIAKALPQVDRVPTALLNLIGKGDHFDATTPLSLFSLHADSPSQAPSPIGGEQSAPIVSAPVAPVTVLPGHDPAIDAAIAQFIGRVQHLDMFMQDRQLVLFDRDIFSPFAPDLDLDSVTFTFSDGSSVSLVGTVDELRHFHWGV
jgi:hypothetical protein